MQELALGAHDRGQMTHGFPVGYEEGGDHFLFNHLTFIVKYHEADHFQGKRVVGFEVIPYSIAHRWEET